jgi:outer membrane autotransporter protein
MAERNSFKRLRNVLLASTVATSATVNQAFAIDEYYIDTELTIDTVSTQPWNNADFLYVGFDGDGTLTIEDGGAVSNSYAYIGFASDSTGTATVTGENSSWNNSGALIAGFRGDGTATIADGGTVSANSIYVGLDSGSTGSVTVTGDGSSLSSGEDLYVGYGGDGTMTIADGGAVSNRWGDIGLYTGSVGSVLVTGENSSWTSRAQIIVGSDGSGSLTIANGATVTVLTDPVYSELDPLSLATYARSTGTINIGAAEGETAVAAGTLDAEFIVFGSGTGTLIFNHTDTDYDFTAGLKTTDGNSTIKQIAGFTTLSGDSSGFLGNTEVTGGTLDVTGSLGGSIAVSGTGTLSGTGTIGTTTVESGGTLSPGGSETTGTLSVNGNLTFETGSTYAVDLGAATGDLTTATGDIIINGGGISVTALDSQSSYTDGQIYTILTASGSLSGEFDSIASESAFLTTTASYDANNAYLTIDVSSDFISVARTGNQRAVARALDSLSQSGTSLALYNAMLTLSAEEAQTAYQQLSGDVYAGAQSVFLQTGQTVNNTINGRMRGISSGPGGTSSVKPLAYAENATDKTPKDDRFAAYEKKAETFDAERFSVWATGFGSWGSVDGTDGGLDTNIGNGGVLFGLDGLVTDAWRVGVMGGYSHSIFDTETSDGSSNNYHVGVYGTGEWGALAVRSGVNYTWSDVGSSRQVTALGQTLNGSYDARSLSAFSEVGYTVKTGLAGFEPFAGLSYSRVTTDSFTETGGSAALTVGGQTSNTAFTTVGLRSSKDFNVLGFDAVARGTAGWVHAFGDVDPTSTARFATGNSFTVSGTPIDQNAALLEAGLDLNLTPSSTFSLTYTGQIGKNAHDNGVSAKLRMQF